MAGRGKRQGGESSREGDDEMSASARSRITRRPVAKGGFYAEGFQAEELADLAPPSRIDDLDEEIALMKVLIRRKWATPKAQEGDAEEIRRYVETLCRAVKTQHSVGRADSQDLTETLHDVLREVSHQTGMQLVPESTTRDVKGEINDGLEQNGN